MSALDDYTADSDGVKAVRAFDTLEAKLTQMCAIAMLLHDETDSELDPVQKGALFAIWTIADECKEMVTALAQWRARAA